MTWGTVVLIVAQSFAIAYGAIALVTRLDRIAAKKYREEQAKRRRDAQV